jgi:hypothetical protein
MHRVKEGKDGWTGDSACECITMVVFRKRRVILHCLIFKSVCNTDGNVKDLFRFNVLKLLYPTSFSDAIWPGLTKTSVKHYYY